MSRGLLPLDDYQSRRIVKGTGGVTELRSFASVLRPILQDINIDAIKDRLYHMIPQAQDHKRKLETVTHVIGQKFQKYEVLLINLVAILNLRDQSKDWREIAQSDIANIACRYLRRNEEKIIAKRQSCMEWIEQSLIFDRLETKCRRYQAENAELYASLGEAQEKIEELKDQADFYQTAARNHEETIKENQEEASRIIFELQSRQLQANDRADFFEKKKRIKLSDLADKVGQVGMCWSSGR